MRKAAFFGATALVLMTSGYVWAQEPSAAQAQQQSHPAQPQTPGQTSAPDHTVPPPPEAQPQAPIADQAKPAAVGPSQANTASAVPAEGPPGATPQTTPSTISAENAKLDKLTTTEHQFPLSEEQRKMIVKSIAAAPTPAAAGLANVHVADFLPTATAVHDFSLEVMKDIPSAKQYKFVKADKRVLIIDPPNRTVVGEIAE
jgi:hypothetical protein